MGGPQSEIQFQLRQGTWSSLQSALAAVRCAVFIDEQGVPESLELDDHDAGSHHVLVVDRAGNSIGAGRIKPDGQIGRMAVLPSHRRSGIGSAILAALCEHAGQSGCAEVYLHAQVEAIPFYKKHGFTIVGDTFYEANIPHHGMYQKLC